VNFCYCPQNRQTSALLKDISVSMSKREQLKDDYLENRLIRQRLIWAAGFTVLLLGLVLGRLYQLQVVEHEHFSTCWRQRLDAHAVAVGKRREVFVLDAFRQQPRAHQGAAANTWVDL